MRFFTILFSFLLVSTAVFAGNPDRQGEAGAYELLMNPWARSAGLNNMATSFITGVESMRLNVAGLSKINQTQVVLAHTRYFESTGISINALGLSQKLSKDGNSAIGISIMTIDFGDVLVTTDAVPEPTGATYSPAFFNLGIGYSTTFENKISVGLLIRGVFESLADISASGFALDAGVQYVSGARDNFKIGVSLRNVGSRMTFGGEALSQQLSSPSNINQNRDITFRVRTASFELPSVLNIGASYDLYPAERHRITILGNFAANSFSRDELGGGVEYGLQEFFMLRAGYKVEVGKAAESAAIVGDPVYTGLSLGATLQAAVKKGSSTKFGIDYAYRPTNPFNGTHNISLRLNI